MRFEALKTLPIRLGRGRESWRVGDPGLLPGPTGTPHHRPIILIYFQKLAEVSESLNNGDELKIYQALRKTHHRLQFIKQDPVKCQVTNQFCH